MEQKNSRLDFILICLNLEVFQMKEYTTASIRVKGSKVSLALNARRLKGALWQDAPLNFSPYDSNGNLIFISIKNIKIQTELIS